MGKSRVALLKPVTIPRLELTAAVCSLTNSQQLHQELEYHIKEEYFWTDSRVVLGYISNESRQFQVFVANRVQEIQENTSVDQWKYIKSKENPAEEASRGMKAHEMPESRWITGPQFLWEKEDQWLTSGRKVHEFQENSNNANFAVKLREISLAEGIEYFSDWHHGKRAVALRLQFRRYLRDHMHQKQTIHKETRKLKVSDLLYINHQVNIINIINLSHLLWGKTLD